MQNLTVVAIVATVGILSAVFARAAAVPMVVPPSGGYFSLKPAGSFASLPSDAQASTLVHRSTWEPRMENFAANHSTPPASYKTVGHSRFTNQASLFDRVTGNYTGTTDEIIQWVAAKWGLPDDVLRAVAVQESRWYQNVKDASGNPVYGKGYGDFNADCKGIGSPPASGYGVNGPSSFGISQVKWCYTQDWGSANGDWPYIETSTAYNLDSYGARFRGCLEGWDTWLGKSAGEQPYAAGDLWGCVGAWYTGLWHTTDSDTYTGWVKSYFDAKPWLAWPNTAPVVVIDPVIIRPPEHATPPPPSVTPGSTPLPGPQPTTVPKGSTDPAKTTSPVPGDAIRKVTGTKPSPQASNANSTSNPTQPTLWQKVVMIVTWPYHKLLDLFYQNIKY